MRIMVENLEETARQPGLGACNIVEKNKECVHAKPTPSRWVACSSSGSQVARHLKPPSGDRWSAALLDWTFLGCREPLRERKQPGIVLLSRPIYFEGPAPLAPVLIVGSSRCSSRSTCPVGSGALRIREELTRPASTSRIRAHYIWRPHHVPQASNVVVVAAFTLLYIDFIRHQNSVLQTHCPLLRSACWFPRTARNRTSRSQCPVFEDRPGPPAVCAHSRHRWVARSLWVVGSPVTISTPPSGCQSAALADLTLWGEGERGGRTRCTGWSCASAWGRRSRIVNLSPHIPGFPVSRGQTCRAIHGTRWVLQRSSCVTGTRTITERDIGSNWGLTGSTVPAHPRQPTPRFFRQLLCIAVLQSLQTHRPFAARWLRVARENLE